MKLRLLGSQLAQSWRKADVKNGSRALGDSSVQLWLWRGSSGELGKHGTVNLADSHGVRNSFLHCEENDVHCSAAETCDLGRDI